MFEGWGLSRHYDALVVDTCLLHMYAVATLALGSTDVGRWKSEPGFRHAGFTRIASRSLVLFLQHRDAQL